MPSEQPTDDTDHPWKVADIVSPVLIAGSIYTLFTGSWRFSIWLLGMAIGIVQVQMLIENRFVDTETTQDGGRDD